MKDFLNISLVNTTVKRYWNVEVSDSKTYGEGITSEKSKRKKSGIS